MKVFFTTLIALAIFSGCASTTRTNHLLNKNTRQAMQIRQQQAEITTLRTKLKQCIATKRKRRRVFSLPPAPKKNIKLKKVEDNNYSSGYMYPSATKKKPLKVAQTTTTSTSTSMDRAQCITMIGQEKFDKYTQMFGSEAASLKRCKMLKAMKQ